MLEARRVASHAARIDVLIVGATLLLKASLLAFGVIVVMILGDSIAPNSPSADLRLLLEPWTRWDAPHYTDLAAFGYRSTGAEELVTPSGYGANDPRAIPTYIVYFPLYPWLIAMLDVVLRDPAITAIVLAGLASSLVGPLLYRLVALEVGPDVARRSVVFLLLFPTAYFLHIGYSESLFLALVLGAFLAARLDRWWLAGLLGALAAATRVNGLVLIPALGVEALIQWWPNRVWRWRWLAIGMIPLGFVAYLVVNVATYGDAFAFLDVQAAFWDKSLSPPWIGISSLINSSLPRAWIPELGFAALGLATTVVAAIRFRPSWAVWMAGNWLLFTSTTFVLSVPRYSLILFPIFVWFAVLARSLRVTLLIAGLSTVGLVYFAGRFALGMWAF